MNDLFDKLQHCLRGVTCLLGVGNVDYGDDGLGVRLAEDLLAADVPGVLIAGTSPERCISYLNGAFSHLVFMDAVDFGGEPGSVVFLSSREMIAKFPQVSTHKISLGTLAKLVESGRKTKAWLLGVQPESTKGGNQLTATVQKTIEALVDVFCSFDPREQAEEAVEKAHA